MIQPNILEDHIDGSTIDSLRGDRELAYEPATFVKISNL